MDSITESKYKYTAGLLLVVILAAFLRLLLLGHKTFHSDEGIIWWMALGQIQQDSPPIYFWAFNWSIQLLGWREIAGRLPSVIYGVLTIPLVYAIGKSSFGRKFGLCGAFLSGISAYLISLSQEMRIYSLLGLEIILVFWLFLHVLKEEKVRVGWWVGLLLVGIAGQYTHCFFIFVLGYFGLVLVVTQGRHGWRNWVKYFGIMVIIIWLSLPELSQTLSVAGGRQHIYAVDFFHLKMNLHRLLRSYFSFLFGDYLTNLPGTIIPYLKTHLFHLVAASMMIGTGILIIILSFCTSIKIARSSGFDAIFMRIVIGMLAVFTLLFSIVDVSSAAHLIIIYVPLLFMFTAFWAFRGGILKWIVGSLYLLLTVVSLISYYQSPYFAWDRSDWRGAGELLKQELKEDDAVQMLRARDAYYTLKFYFPEMEGDIYYRPRHDPESAGNQALVDWWDKTSSLDKVEDLLKDHKRVWVVESDFPREQMIQAGNFDTHSWNFGYNLEVHLIKRKPYSPGDS